MGRAICRRCMGKVLHHTHISKAEELPSLTHPPPAQWLCPAVWGRRTCHRWLVVTSGLPSHSPLCPHLYGQGLFISLSRHEEDKTALSNINWQQNKVLAMKRLFTSSQIRHDLLDWPLWQRCAHLAPPEGWQITVIEMYTPCPSWRVADPCDRNVHTLPHLKADRPLW